MAYVHSTSYISGDHQLTVSLNYNFMPPSGFNLCIILASFPMFNSYRYKMNKQVIHRKKADRGLAWDKIDLVPLLKASDISLDDLKYVS